MNTHAALQLKVMQVTAFQPTQQVTGIVPFANIVIFKDAQGAQGRLYRFDGQNVTLIDNPLNVMDPQSGLPASGQSAGALSGQILAGKYYFNAAISSGSALFKTDGSVIELVADIDPGTDPNSQPISEMLATQENLYLRALGPNGRELFRTDGTNVVEYDLNPGVGSSNPFDFFRFNESVIFSARDPQSGLRAVWEANGPDVKKVYGGATVMTVFNGGILLKSGNSVYNYDGTTVAKIPEFDGIANLNARYGDGTFVAFSGQDATGWGVFTWDGSTFRKVRTNPDGIAQGPDGFLYFEGKFYYKLVGANGHELYRTDGVTVEEFDINPGPASSSFDLSHLASLNGDVFLFASDSRGKELWRLTDSGAEIVADINPAGDAFYLTHENFLEYKDRFYFEARMPSGNQWFRSDGYSVQPLRDVFAGLDDIVQVGPDGFFPDLLQITIDSDPNSPGEETYLTDGAAVFSLDAALGFPWRGPNYAGSFRWNDALFYFTHSGEVLKVEVVPEPASLIVGVMALACAVCSRRELKRRV